MNGTLTLLTMVLSVAFTGVLVEWIARDRHPRRLFSIALGRERTAADEARVARLRIGNAIVTAIGVASVLVPGPAWLLLTGLLGCPMISAFWLVFEATAAARSANLETVPGRWVVSLGEPPGVGAYVSIPLQVLNLLVVVIPTATFAWRLGSLPESIPAHFDAAGRVDRMGNPAELWLFGGIMLFDLLLLYAMVLAIAKERWALPEHDVEEYAGLALERRRLMVRMMEWLILVINAGMALPWMAVAFGRSGGDPELVMILTTITVVLVLGGTLVPIVVFIPRLTKVADGLRRIAGTEALGTRPSGWIWGGMIYYAPDDPAVFVPKRMGIGQTVNFARPSAWIFLGAVVFLPVIIAIVAVLAS